MMSATLGTLAGACALLAALCILLALPVALVTARRPALSAAPVAGCAFSGFVWAGLAIVLSWMGSALAGR